MVNFASIGQVEQMPFAQQIGREPPFDRADGAACQMSGRSTLNRTSVFVAACGGYGNGVDRGR